MNRNLSRLFLSTLTVMSTVISTVLLHASNAIADDARPPNFLIILADDCTHSDLPVYGGKNVQTPNIDKFASQSLVFRHAYLSEAMCQPCRSELYTGLYPVRNGSAWNHSASRPSVTSIAQHLKQLKYRVGLAGKVHVLPKAVFPFQKVDGFDKSCVRNPTKDHSTDGVREFITRSDDQRFCLVVALVEPHVPWVMGDASKYPPAKIELPPYLADTEGTRAAYSKYLAEITYMDGQVGDILRTLDESGKADDTLVMFSSEQGSQFPGCKWTNWDTGLHTALIARWPGKVGEGAETKSIVQYADVAPTLVELAGGDAGEFDYDGRSFAKVLTAPKTPHREFAFGIHNNVPEGPSYPIRTVSNGKFRYIRNLKPDEIYIEKHLMGWRGGGELNNPYWLSWVYESEANENTEMLMKRYMKRPAEELYDTENDPFEMNNLAKVGKHSEMRTQLSTELDSWMESQGDPGIPLDSKESLKAAKQGKHLY